MGRSQVFSLALSAFLLGCTEPSPQPTPREAAWLGYFPSSYEQSRQRFRDECRARIASPEDFCKSSPVSSPTDPDLTIDYGFFGSSGDRLVVIQSGIHGSEGAAGAAVQELVLHDYLARLLSNHIDVFFIHALNPYGFKYVRRTDEFNVNLNRNFAIEAKDYQTPNSDYDRLRGLFEPMGPVGNVWTDSVVSHWHFIARLAGDGFDATSLTNGLDSGQYRYPKGMNYGGYKPAQQVAFLKEALRPVMARPYRKILFLDFHTGLGNDGELAVIKGIHPSDELLREFSGLLRDRQKDGIVVRSGEDQGFFPTSGDVIDFAPTLAGPVPGASDSRMLAVTMEYGTMGAGTASQLRSASRMILENQAHFNGCATADECAVVRDDFRELFNPSDPRWRLKVMREADVVFSQLLTWER
jgi:hypothetical protein